MEMKYKTVAESEADLKTGKYQLLLLLEGLLGKSRVMWLKLQSNGMLQFEF
jgi:hypothetical protein